MQSSDSKNYFYIIGIIAICIILYATRQILAPFVVAFIIAYALDPLVDKLEEWKLPRTMAIVFFILFILIILTLTGMIAFPAIKLQVERLAGDMPDYTVTIQQWFSPIFENVIKEDPARIKEVISNLMEKLGNIPPKLLASTSSLLWSGFSGMLNFIITMINLVIIPISCFYFLKDIDTIKEKIKALIPTRYKETVFDLTQETNEVLGAFIRGQLTVAIILAVFYSVGLSIIGTPMSIVIGIVAGLANIVPYLGLLVGLIPAILLTVLQFHGVAHLLGVLLVFGIAQAMEGMVITPRIVGDKIGLHPVVIMLAILAGGRFFGFIGILLAVPVAAVLNVFLKRGIERYKESTIFLQE
jgi:predicted PurR-regulated permease PerM